MKILTLCLLLWCAAFIPREASAADPVTACTEFYCTFNGTNVNSGDSTNDVAQYTSLHGNWTNSTSTFLPTDGTFPALTNTIGVGRFASVVIDASTNMIQTGLGGYVARIATINSGANGTIVLDTVALAGTAPANQVGTATLRVGGAWHGAYMTNQYPFGSVTGTLTNTIGNTCRVNFQSGYSNVPTTTITHNTAGPVIFQGYTSVPGDGGKGIIDANGGNFPIITIGTTATFSRFVDMYVQNSSSAGANYGLTMSGANSEVKRCVFRWTGYSGVTSTAAGVNFIEDEWYNCNTGNGSSQGGVKNTGAGVTFKRCLSHHNTTANGDGFYLAGGQVLENCLSISNGFNGFNAAGNPTTMYQCDSVSNKVHGLFFSLAGTAYCYVENGNFLANGGFGISCITNQLRTGSLVNNWFGSGSQANGSGNYSPNIGATNSLVIIGTGTYAAGANPYVAMSSQNFTLSSSATSFGAGRGAFTDIKFSGGTISYPSIGAAATTNGASSGGGAYTFAQ